MPSTYVFNPELLKRIETTKAVEKQFKTHGKRVNYSDQNGKVTALVLGDRILIESQEVILER